MKFYPPFIILFKINFLKHVTLKVYHVLWKLAIGFGFFILYFLIVFPISILFMYLLDILHNTLYTCSVNFIINLFKILRRYIDYALMEIELTDKASIVNLPTFINVLKEVTDDPQYINHTLARTQSFPV